MPLAVYALTFSMFALGTTEFVIVGLLPTIADSFHVSASTTGLIVTAYALGIAIGGPLLTSITARMSRRRLLLGLMGVFVAGNVVCGVAPDFGILIAARVVTAFAHGSIASVGVVLAISLVDKNRQGRAIAAVFGGVMIALAIGVPVGTVLGQLMGWRAAFFAVAIMGSLALAADLRLLPAAPPGPLVPLRRQLSLLTDPLLLLALLTTVSAYAGLMATYTYISLFLERITGFHSGSIGLLLVVFGVAASAGNFTGGPIVDRWPRATSAMGLGVLACILALMTVLGESRPGAVVSLLALGGVGWGLAVALQHQTVRAAPHSADMVSALNISAANLGIAAGALIGGRVVAGVGVHAVTWVGAIIVAASAVLATIVALNPRPTVTAVNAC